MQLTILKGPVMLRTLKLIIYISLIGFLTACGGGSNSGAPETSSENSVSAGIITGFGSVFINGSRFHTDSATITADDKVLGDVTELKVGMVARVTSDSTTHVASEVNFEEDIKGPLDATINDFNAPFSVMGQTVIVDSATVIDNSLSLPLNAGDILEISGLRQANDSLLATYIEDKAFANVNKFKVIGKARSIDTDARTFTIDGLSISYASADVSDLLSGNPVDGQLVEVKDENKSYVAGSHLLTATKIEPFDHFNGNGDPDMQAVEIETVVIAVSNPGSQFQIPNFTVNILAGTTFLYGAAAEIGVGSVVQVKGIRKSGDEIDATRIRFKRNSTRMEAPVDSGGVDVGNNQLTVLGIIVQLNDNTDMEDDRDGVTPFTINDINDSDYLEIRGFTAANGVFVASELERDDADSKVEIRSVVSNIDAVGKSLAVLGITVTAGAGTQFNDGSLTSDAFFSALIEGQTVVEVKWDPFVSVATVPKEMEMEDNDDDD
ncbi:MAG: hypothetical protein ACI9LO_002366 [Planctomycetota bacterium]|jgi:hypothetical protein